MRISFAPITSCFGCVKSALTDTDPYNHTAPYIDPLTFTPSDTPASSSGRATPTFESTSPEFTQAVERASLDARRNWASAEGSTLDLSQVSPEEVVQLTESTFNDDKWLRQSVHAVKLPEGLDRVPELPFPQLRKISVPAFKGERLDLRRYAMLRSVFASGLREGLVTIPIKLPRGARLEHPSCERSASNELPSIEALEGLASDTPRASASRFSMPRVRAASM